MIDCIIKAQLNNEVNLSQSQKDASKEVKLYVYWTTSQLSQRNEHCREANAICNHLIFNIVYR